LNQGYIAIFEPRLYSNIYIKVI